MLSNLLIKNYALIQHLEMQPASGLNIITGETGAGKSIMVGAIGLLMGKRADTKVLLQKEHKCIIEGTFNIKNYALQWLFLQNNWEYDPQTIIRREINTSGKSRAFINDSPVNLESLRSLGVHLLDIHSQNDTLQLGAREFQLNVLDVYGQNQAVLTKYQRTYDRWVSLKKEQQELLIKSREQQKESDYNKFLLEELRTAALDPSEQETLEDSLQLMEHAEEIKLQIQNSLEILDHGDYGANEQLAAATHMLSKIRDYSSQYQALQARLESSLIELKDIVEELRMLDQEVEHDPAEIETLKSRLDTIYRLQKKHAVNTIRDLVEIKENLSRESEQLVHLDDTLKEIEQQIREVKSKLMEVGTQLSNSRKQVFQSFTQKMEDLLGKLGMPESRLSISCQQTDPGSNGLDDIQWTFSANKGIVPQPISKVASGGELSRLLFCVKYLMADKVSLPTILFDEIDSGISGEVALQMVEMMHEMSGNHQVLTISHLPQFAARGDHHYYVYKESDVDTTTSGIRKLEGAERVKEIAKMLGGDNPSEIAFANAKELMGTVRALEH
ncbi:MAG: DNA repair protein RecN [Bacteroidetes bacterium]|nr:MAG: DNA repair protein RecN [Bacteroidota bacterium]